MLGLAMKAGKGIERRICDRAGRKERQRIPCHSGGNGVGQYTEEISQYVCIL